MTAVLTNSLKLLLDQIICQGNFFENPNPRQLDGQMLGWSDSRTASRTSSRAGSRSPTFGYMELRNGTLIRTPPS